MTSRTRYRIAAVVALVLGLMTIIEGASVLLGVETKKYHVLPWLVQYNVVFGFVSLLAGVGLWMKRNWAGMLAKVILICHGVVFLSLSVMHLLGMAVAMISIMAMLFRTTIWIVINYMIRERTSQKPTGSGFAS